MNREELTKLAERVESLTGPDHSVDAAIMCALHGYTMHEESDPANGIFAFWEGEPWGSICHNCTSWAEPTASLDAAMSLVPKRQGWHTFLASQDRHSGRWKWHLRGGFGANCKAFAATSALALTAAALRALAEQLP